VGYNFLSKIVSESIVRNAWQLRRFLAEEGGFQMCSVAANERIEYATTENRDVMLFQSGDWTWS
jgi:hypothetical protein